MTPPGYHSNHVPLLNLQLVGRRSSLAAQVLSGAGTVHFQVLGKHVAGHKMQGYLAIFREKCPFWAAAASVTLQCDYRRKTAA